MKILQLCKKVPYPPKDGEAIAILTLTKGLHRAGHEVQVLAMNTPKHAFSTAQLPLDIQQIAAFETVFVDTSLSIHRAVANLFTNESYNVYRFVSAKFTQKLASFLQKNRYDIIHLEGVYLAPYIKTIREYSDAPIVMRAHNIEFEIWERLAQTQQNFLKRWYFNLLARRLKYFELQSLLKYDGLLPISIKDEQYFRQYGFTKSCLTIPASVDLGDYPFCPEKADFPSLFFIGSLDWMPNQEGLLWFLEKVWPDIHITYPTLKFYVAGRNIPTWLAQQQHPNVVILGEVPDARAFMQSKSLMIVPLFSGSGMRVKIIEAMALGKPIVATSLAAEGIACTHHTDIMLADDAAAFGKAIRACLANQVFCEELGKNARQFIAQHHSTDVLITKMVEFYNSLLT